MNQVKLKEIALIRTGYPFRGRIERDPEGAISVIQMKDLDDYNCLDLSDVYKVQLEDLNQQYLLRPGDILFRSRGVSKTAVLVSEVKESLVAAAPLVLIRVKSRKVEPAYLVWYLNHPHGQFQIGRLSEGTSVLMISKSALAELEISLPVLAIQKAIAEIAALSQQEQQLLDELAKKRQTYTNAVLMRHVKA